LWDATYDQSRVLVENINTPIRDIAWDTTSDVNYLVAGGEDGSVRMWQVVEDGDECHVRLRWRTVNGELVVTGTLIQDVHGLSQIDKQLLKQRGATGEPIDHLRTATKKVTSMVSVLSALKQQPTRAPSGPSSIETFTFKQPQRSEQPVEWNFDPYLS
jgi:WD40 repeat protein